MSIVEQSPSAGVHDPEIASATRLVVVADRFNGFAQDMHVHTVSGLSAQIGRGELDDVEVFLLCGQGVGQFERDYVQSAIDRRGLADQIRFVGDGPPPAGRDVVHKNSADNVLLAGLRRSGERRYTADLRMHGNNELLLDHQTGEHVQGMVVVEAARQFFLGVFEIGYRGRWPLRNFYVVWNSVRLSFDSFLFPLPAQITGTVRELSVDQPDRHLDFEVDLALTQADKTVATGIVGFSCFSVEKINLLERRRAARAISHRLATPAGH
jgi:hypothetical protein